MQAPDTSVLVAAFASWHERHREAAHAVAGCRLIGHTAIEMLSVLTRLPEPHRAPGSLVARYLTTTFTDPPLALAGSDLRDVPRRLVDAGVTGGAVYDGLIALTAKLHGATLVSLDRRAAENYDVLGVDYLLLDHNG